MNYKHLKRISLKSHPTLNEAWVQKVIAENPIIIGLGDVYLKDKERPQPRAGRLDLLFQDVDGIGRYEVEVQLGYTDEAHIIRTIEYWDIEKRKYPQYDHTAVLIAEDITSRFLNVVSLFNGFIPLMAFQISALQVSEKDVFLNFTKVLDTVKLGLIDEDEEVQEKTDRVYWENKATKATVKLAGDILSLVQEFEPSLDISYNKYYIGFWYNDHAFNFATIRPQKSGVRLEIKLEQSEEIDDILSEKEIEMLDYQKRWGAYRLKLSKEDIQTKREILKDLLKRAFDRRS